jgi:hypothetical protein
MISRFSPLLVYARSLLSRATKENASVAADQKNSSYHKSTESATVNTDQPNLVYQKKEAAILATRKAEELYRISLSADFDKAMRHFNELKSQTAGNDAYTVNNRQWGSRMTGVQKHIADTYAHNIHNSTAANKLQLLKQVANKGHSFAKQVIASYANQFGKDESKKLAKSLQAVSVSRGRCL